MAKGGKDREKRLPDDNGFKKKYVKPILTAYGLLAGFTNVFGTGTST